MACARSLELDHREHVTLRDPRPKLNLEIDDAAGDGRQHLQGARRVGFHHGWNHQGALDFLRGGSFDRQLPPQWRVRWNSDAFALPNEM